MSCYVFAAHPAAGHLSSLLAIADQLRAAGHRIYFAVASTAQVRRRLQDRGFELIAHRLAVSTTGLLLLPWTSGFVETSLAIELFFSGLPHYARCVGRALDQVHADCVVTDFAFHGAALAAEARGLPFVNIHHAGLNFPGPKIPPFGSGLPIGKEWGARALRYRRISDWLARRLRAKVAQARGELGLLAPVTFVGGTPISPWLHLVLTTESSEAPRDPLPPSVFFVGPALVEPNADRASRFPFSQLAVDKKTIYVSLGTVFNNKPRVFRKIQDAFADGRHQLVVSAGKAADALRARDVPGHVHLFDWVPQVELLPRVDAVISHGGNNTVNETLAAGKPLLVMPVGGEQGDNASRVVYLGTGLRTDLTRSTSDEIRTNTDRLLEDASFSARCQAIARAIAQTNGAATGARFIEHVVSTQQPLSRPADYPLTVPRDLLPPSPR